MEEKVDNSFNFDRRERDPKSILAWLLMHNPPEWIEKITKVPDYDVTNIRVDITVNGIPFGVSQFEEIVAPLAAAYAEHEMRHNGLYHVKASAKAQAQHLVAAAHNGLYDAAGEVMSQLEIMRESLEGLTSMFWRNQESSSLSAQGLFSLLMPGYMDYYPNDPYTWRKPALAFICDLGMLVWKDQTHVQKFKTLANSLCGQLDREEVNYLYGRLGEVDGELFLGAAIDIPVSPQEFVHVQLKPTIDVTAMCNAIDKMFMESPKVIGLQEEVIRAGHALRHKAITAYLTDAGFLCENKEQE